MKKIIKHIIKTTAYNLLGCIGVMIEFFLLGLALIGFGLLVALSIKYMGFWSILGIPIVVIAHIIVNYIVNNHLS